MNPDLSGSLEEQVDELRLRVRRLEDALTHQGILAQEFLNQPLAEPVNTAQTIETDALAAAGVAQAQEIQAPPIIAPNFGYSGQTAALDNRSLESRIGSQWFNRVGILAVLIGMAWFLKLAIDNHWIGPLGES